MSNNYFSFKQFTIYQDKCAFKVGTDGVILGAYADVRGKKRILDIGTGTGLIALMLAQRSDAEIVAIEPDHDSFIQASENIQQSKWSNRISIENKSLQEYAGGNEKFDLIVSNPPYFIDSMRNPDAVKSSARHNVSLTQEDLLQGVSRLLDDNGLFQLILPYTEGLLFIAEASGYGFFCNSILKIKPLPSAPVKRVVLGFGRKREKTAEKFLTIEKGRRHDFTDEYISLTKEFYLKF
ncbi:MAG: methyltransferase [Bacteroidales bacterium]|nr:methyltransferase [Bacteroidales bacterium]